MDDAEPDFFAEFLRSTPKSTATGMSQCLTGLQLLNVGCRFIYDTNGKRGALNRANEKGLGKAVKMGNLLSYHDDKTLLSVVTIAPLSSIFRVVSGVWLCRLYLLILRS